MKTTATSEADSPGSVARLGLTRLRRLESRARRRARLRKKWLQEWLKDRHLRAARAQLHALRTRPAAPGETACEKWRQTVIRNH